MPFADAAWVRVSARGPGHRFAFSAVAAYREKSFITLTVLWKFTISSLPASVRHPYSVCPIPSGTAHAAVFVLTEIKTQHLPSYNHIPLAILKSIHFSSLAAYSSDLIWVLAVDTVPVSGNWGRLFDGLCLPGSRWRIWRQWTQLCCHAKILFKQPVSSCHCLFNFSSFSINLVYHSNNFVLSLIFDRWYTSAELVCHFSSIFVSPMSQENITMPNWPMLTIKLRCWRFNSSICIFTFLTLTTILDSPLLTLAVFHTFQIINAWL